MMQSINRYSARRDRTEAAGRVVGLCALAITLQGCSTVSFATPEIPMAGHASFSSHYDASPCAATVLAGTSVIDRDDLTSAVDLIDNYAGAYSCALQSAADGRQYFQIPSQLAALVGVVGAAFGGSADLALGAGAAAATFNSANGYWAPQEKANVLDSALDAIECIRMAAVGLDAYKTRDDAPAALTDADEVPIPVSWRYYDSIKSALSQVNRIAGSRLRETGKFDPDGLVAQIQKLTEEIEQRKNDQSGEPVTVPPPPGDAGAGDEAAPPGQDDRGGPNVPATGADAVPANPRGPRLAPGIYRVNIPLMQSRLQLCVVKAKI